LLAAPEDIHLRDRRETGVEQGFHDIVDFFRSHNGLNHGGHSFLMRET
jgi:hypothetical protein